MLDLINKMKIRVHSKSKKDVAYVVDTLALTCTCLDFEFRRKPRGEWCKHLREEIPRLGDKINEMLKFINHNSDVFEFIEMYGEEALEYLKLKGDVMEFKTKLKILK